MERRDFLAVLPLAGLLGCRDGGAEGAGAAESSAVPAPAVAMTPLDRPGVQLYTVREAMGEAPEATLARLAEIGFREVELAGTYGNTPNDFRGMLDRAGLRALSSHVSIQEVRERWPETLDGANALGQELIVVPSLGRDDRTPDGLLRVAEDFERAGEAARSAGLRFGYHNHQWELQGPADALPMDVLLDGTSPDHVDWQMDIYWAVDAGVDPLAWMDRHPGRVTSVHIKDRTAEGEMVDVGDGVIDFASILAAGAAGPLRYGFIEHDFPDDPMESVRRSFEHLTRGGSP